jgi:hypothetical protein
METVGLSETLVSIYQAKQRKIPDYSILTCDLCEKLET